MKKSTTRTLLAPIALIGALTLTACNQGEQAAFEEPTTQQSAAAPETQAAPAEDETAEDETAEDETAEDEAAEDETGDDVTTESAVAAGVNLAELGEPIASTTAPARVKDDPEATMDVNLYSLKRDGDTVTAIMSITVNSPAGSEEDDMIYGYLGGRQWYPFLVDTKNLNRHDVLGGVSNRTGVMTHYQGNRFRPGQTLFAFATFAAPPEDVTTMTVHMIDGAQAVTEVPIQ